MTTAETTQTSMITMPSVLLTTISANDTLPPWLADILNISTKAEDEQEKFGLSSQSPSPETETNLSTTEFPILTATPISIEATTENFSPNEGRAQIVDLVSIKGLT